MEEEKNKNGLYIVIIIFLVLCLIGSGFFIYKRIYQEPIKEEPKQEEKNEKIEIPNLSNILKMIPVKRESANYIGYKVEELTNEEILETIINYIVMTTEFNNDEKCYVEKISNIEDNLIKFLELKNYNIEFDNNKNYLGYKLEKVTENEVDYLKVKTTELSGRVGGIELQDLNNITYDKNNDEYVVNVLVIEQLSEGPSLEIGKANIYLNKNDDLFTLKQVEFEKYDESVIKENTGFFVK